jgi:hypothetical protein
MRTTQEKEEKIILLLLPLLLIKPNAVPCFSSSSVWWRLLS